MTGPLNESDSSPNLKKSSDPVDIFDEFEFKPITSGLGFHNRKKTPQSPQDETLPKINLPFKGALSGLDLLDDTKTAEPLQTKVQDSNLKKINPVEFSQSSPQSPPQSLLRSSAQASPQAKVAEILSDLKQKRQQESVTTKKAQGPLYQQSYPDFSALILDTMLVVALALSCLILLILGTEADLVQIALASPHEFILTSSILLLAMISWSYLVLTRIFMGHTPGEWVFDQRLFLPQEEFKFSSRLKLIFRATLVVMTGWLLLPLLSMLFRKDLAGALSGARIYRKLF
jgi:hypothetical protein